MAKTGQPAFDSGMRGSSKPKDKASGDGKAKTGKVTSVEIRPSANGGFINRVSRSGGEANEIGNYQGPEEHTHPDKGAAHQHVGELMDEMGSAAKHEKGVHGGKQEDSPNVGTGDED